MLLHRNCRSCCMVRVFLPLCWVVESCCLWQGEKGKFFSFCIRCCISIPSLTTTPVKPNAPCTRCLSGFACCPLGTVCPGDFRGCQHLSPLCRPPQAAASSWCLSLSAPSCCLQDLPPAAVSMDAFPHQTRADSGCGAFSCLQAVLENSFALSSEITWGVADPFPGYHCAVSQDVSAQLGLTSRLPCIPEPSRDSGVFAGRTGVPLVPPECCECL